MLTTLPGRRDKYFLMQFDTGKQAIAKIPSPSLLPRSDLFTASQAATISYLHDLNVPVPRLLTWSHSPDIRKAVGVDFLIFERPHGTPLSFWDRLEYSDITSPVYDVADLDARFSTTGFSQIGSIFFKEDVPETLRDRPFYAKDTMYPPVVAEKYRVGPFMDPEWWEGWREDEVAVDRGPCAFMLLYFVFGLSTVSYRG